MGINIALKILNFISFCIIDTKQSNSLKLQSLWTFTGLLNYDWKIFTNLQIDLEC